MWRRVVDMQTYEILEDSSGPHQPLDFERPLDLWVCWWGLPLDFVKLSAFSSHAVLPIHFFSSGTADVALRLGPEIGISK